VGTGSGADIGTSSAAPATAGGGPRALDPGASRFFPPATGFVGGRA